MWVALSNVAVDQRSRRLEAAAHPTGLYSPFLCTWPPPQAASHVVPLWMHLPLQLVCTQFMVLENSALCSSALIDNEASGRGPPKRAQQGWASQPPGALCTSTPKGAEAMLGAAKHSSGRPRRAN